MNASSPPAVSQSLVPSDDIGNSLREKILAQNVQMLRKNGIIPGALPNGFVPVDIDVSPFDNSKTKK
jgi:hypothetical protein